MNQLRGLKLVHDHIEQTQKKIVVKYPAMKVVYSLCTLYLGDFKKTRLFQSTNPKKYADKITIETVVKKLILPMMQQL